MSTQPTPQQPFLVFSIRNHLGKEVGSVQFTNPTLDPIAVYAMKVHTTSEKLIAAGYTAKQI